MFEIKSGIGWVRNNSSENWVSADPHHYVAEIERLRSVIKGVEIALARDEDISGAMKVITENR